MLNFVVKLKFRSPVHFGYKEKTYQLSEITASADTIFSAICNSWRLLYGSKELEEMLNAFVEGNPPFLISSSFPYYKDEFYVPKPVGINLSKLVNDIKKAKKIKYLPINCLAGKIALGGYSNIKQGFVLKEDTEYIYFNQEIPRIVTDSITSYTDIFYVQAVSFNRGAGLYFFLTINNEAFLSKIKASIYVLGDEGLGGERTYGYGLFNAQFTEVTESNLFNSHSGTYLLLSPYLPHKDELMRLNPISYDFKERNGYIYSMGGQNIRRKSVIMFSEGSVFSNKPVGTLADITPPSFKEHKVYRYGLAYTMPVQLSGGIIYA